MADDQRIELAEDRTVFAAERTYAAWVRTGLAALIAGIGGVKFLAGTLFVLEVKAAGTVLALFAVFCFGAAIWRELSPGLGARKPDVPRIPSWVLFAMNACLSVVALMAMAGMWLY